MKSFTERKSGSEVFARISVNPSVFFSSTGNQVKGLSEDETKFLDFVSSRQEEFTKKRADEDAEVIKEYKISFYHQLLGVFVYHCSSNLVSIFQTKFHGKLIVLCIGTRTSCRAFMRFFLKPIMSGSCRETFH